MERYLEKHESMTLVAKKLRAKRPHVKDTTLIAYLNHFRMAEMANPIAHVDKVQQEIEKIYKPTTQKNAYNSISVVMDALGKPELSARYGELRDEAHSKYEAQAKSHKKSPAQEKNWVSMAEIDSLLQTLSDEAKKIYKRENVSNKDFMTLQQRLLLKIYREFPLRNDVAHMRIITPHKYKTADKKENYLVGTPAKGYAIHLNSYKTDGTFGAKVIQLTPELNGDVRKWLKFNTTGFLFVNALREPISANGITKLFTRLFQQRLGKNVSTSMIRHIYLSDKYKDDLEEKTEDSYNMGHSLAMQKDYIKF